MNRYLIQAAFLVAISGQGHGRADESNSISDPQVIDQILGELQKRRMSHSSATFTIERKSPVNKLGKQTFELETCAYEEIILDGRVHSRTECAERIGPDGAGVAPDLSSITIIDATDRYFWNPAGDVVGKQKLDCGGTDDSAISYVRDNHTVSITMPGTDHDGVVMLGFEGQGDQAGGDRPLRVRLEFNADGLLISSMHWSSNGKTIREVLRKDVRYDVPIDPQRLVFVQPEGLDVVDWACGKPLAITIGKKKE